MSAGNYDFEIEQGATFRRTLTISDAAGDPINLTGYTFRGMVRAKYDSASPLATFSFTPANQGTDPGVVVVSLTDTDTSAITVPAATSAERTLTTYLYDIEMVDGSSIVTRVLQGAAIISPEATK